MCNKVSKVLNLEEIKGFIVVEEKSFKTNKVLEKILLNCQLLRKSQVNMLKTQTNFSPLFCESCVKQYTRPSFFKDCQNQDCQNENFFPIELKTSLDLFKNLPHVKCRVETAMWCQECRQDQPTAAEIRGFNKILDRLTKETKVCLVPSFRTHRASHFQAHLAPRAVAVFPVVSSNLPNLQKKPNQNQTDICDQLSMDEGASRYSKIKRTEIRKYRAYDKIEVNLRKLIFGEKALESLLFSREEFSKSGVTFRADEFNDQHIASLLKVNMKRKQLRVLQQSMSQVMGHKLTGNLKKTLKEARNSGLVDAGSAGVLHCGEY